MDGDVAIIADILNEASLICGKDLVCTNTGIPSYPGKCAQEFVLDKDTVISKKCLECFKTLHSFKTSKVFDAILRKHAKERYEAIKSLVNMTQNDQETEDYIDAYGDPDNDLENGGNHSTGKENQN